MAKEMNIVIAKHLLLLIAPLFSEPGCGNWRLLPSDCACVGGKKTTESRARSFAAWSLEILRHYSTPITGKAKHRMQFSPSCITHVHRAQNYRAPALPAYPCLGDTTNKPLAASTLRQNQDKSNISLTAVPPQNTSVARLISINRSPPDAVRIPPVRSPATVRKVELVAPFFYESLTNHERITRDRSVTSITDWEKGRP
jgi:hypothetical protein